MGFPNHFKALEEWREQIPSAMKEGAAHGGLTLDPFFVEDRRKPDCCERNLCSLAAHGMPCAPPHPRDDGSVLLDGRRMRFSDAVTDFLLGAAASSYGGCPAACRSRLRCSGAIRSTGDADRVVVRVLRVGKGVSIRLVDCPELETSQGGLGDEGGDIPHMKAQLHSGLAQLQ